MTNNDTVINEYVPKELFDVHIQNIKDKAASDEKLTDARFEALEKLLDERFNRLQAIVEKNLAEHKAVAAKTETEISNISGEVKTLNERIEHAIDTLSIAISNNNQRLDDLRDEIAKNNLSLSLNGASIPLCSSELFRSSSPLSCTSGSNGKG